MASFSVGNVLSAGLGLVPALTLRFAPVIAVAIAPMFLSAITRESAWTLLYVVLEIAMASILTHAASETMSGNRTSVLASVRAGLRRTPAAIGAMLLVYMVTFALMLALWFPLGVAAFVAGPVAVIVVWLLTAALLVALYSRWFVTIPAVVVDRVGPMDALSRSAQLTEGRRGRIAALIVLLHAMPYALVIAFVIAFARRSEGRVLVDDTSSWVPVVSIALWVLYTILRAVLAAAAHHLIKRDVEAASPDELARVFG